MQIQTLLEGQAQSIAALERILIKLPSEISRQKQEREPVKIGNSFLNDAEISENVNI